MAGPLAAARRWAIHDDRQLAPGLAGRHLTMASGTPGASTTSSSSTSTCRGEAAGRSSWRSAAASRRSARCSSRGGWRVRDGLEVSAGVDRYRDYIGASRAEFTVAKDQNVRLRTGWFSDRSATYLASGRPVLTQDTGFGNALPTGEGLFGFELLRCRAGGARGDQRRLQRATRAAARELAREHFSHEAVLRRDCSRRSGSSLEVSAGHSVPPRFSRSRWSSSRSRGRPTTLPHATVEAAREHPALAHEETPALGARQRQHRRRHARWFRIHPPLPRDRASQHR